MTPPPESLTIASRGSRLALRQARIVTELLESAHPSLDVRVARVSTTGDRDRRPFGAIGGKGLFTTEVERELVEGRADVAVHSAKDLTAELAPGCSIVCVPARAEPCDVVLGPAGAGGAERLASLPSGAVVGTSSMRRRALLAEARPDLDATELRGNLDTRLRKLADGEVDAAVLAAAGLQRLQSIDDLDAGRLDPTWWVPAPAQGALAIEALDARPDVKELFAPLRDGPATAEVTCERAFAAALEGGCSVPIGCLARVQGATLLVSGFLGAPFGGSSLRDRLSGGVSEAAALGRELAQAILDAGGRDLLEEIAAADTVEPSAP